MKSIKLRCMVAAVSGALLMGFGANAMADSTDDIVNALMAKGVLTEEEGALLLKGRSGEKEAAEAKKKTAITPKFNNGIVFENEDKTTSFKVGGRVHADYRYFDRDVGSKSTTVANAANESDTFDIRRARIELSGKFYGAYEFLISTDLAGTSAGNTSSVLDQAWLNINYWKPVQFRFGQFKAPMNLEKVTSSNNIDFQERSYVNQLAANEDRGAMVWGIPKDGFTYALAVTNGEGAKNRNDADPRVDKVEYIGRGTINFAEIMGNKDAVYHVGAAGSYTELAKATGNGYLSGTNAFRTEARGINFLTLPTITGAANVDNAIERTRYGVEAALAQGPFKVQGEWLRNKFEADLTTTAKLDKDVDAWYLEALWLITGEKYADSYKEGAFGGIKPKNNFEWGKGTGAWEAGLRYSKLDASDFKTPAVALPNVGAVNPLNNTLEADTWTVGLKFLPTANTRFLVNFIQTSFDTPITIAGKERDKERAITMRAQINF
ncbi:MAG TPA: porin [Methylophilaceae bacterium]|nr:porin [Methylophilaceae bacterium]